MFLRVYFLFITSSSLYYFLHIYKKLKNNSFNEDSKMKVMLEICKSFEKRNKLEFEKRINDSFNTGTNEINEKI